VQFPVRESPIRQTITGGAGRIAASSINATGFVDGVGTPCFRGHGRSPAFARATVHIYLLALNKFALIFRGTCAILASYISRIRVTVAVVIYAVCTVTAGDGLGNRRPIILPGRIIIT
jgi:hypothetical protein